MHSCRHDVYLTWHWLRFIFFAKWYVCKRFHKKIKKTVNSYTWSLIWIENYRAQLIELSSSCIAMHARNLWKCIFNEDWLWSGSIVSLTCAHFMTNLLRFMSINLIWKLPFLEFWWSRDGSFTLNCDHMAVQNFS